MAQQACRSASAGGGELMHQIMKAAGINTLGIFLA